MISGQSSHFSFQPYRSIRPEQLAIAFPRGAQEGLQAESHGFGGQKWHQFCSCDLLDANSQ